VKLLQFDYALCGKALAVAVLQLNRRVMSERDLFS
jgi:hypothetical protein